MGLYVVEYALDPAAAAARPALLAGLRRCLAVREVRPVARFASKDGVREIAAFEAGSAEAVIEAHRSSGVPFAACWPAEAAG